MPPAREPNRCDVTAISYQIAVFANSLYPGFRNAKLAVTLADGEVATFPISSTLLVTVGKATLQSPEGAMESAIVEALEALGPDETVTGEELSKLAGYPNSGRFRGALSRLVRTEQIVNLKPGYRLPD